MGFLPEKFYFIHFDLISLEELSNATKRVDTFIEGIISEKSEISDNSAGDKRGGGDYHRNKFNGKNIFLKTKKIQHIFFYSITVFKTPLKFNVSNLFILWFPFFMFFFWSLINIYF